jgi:ribosome-associated protein
MPKSAQTPIDPAAPPSRSQQRRDALDVLRLAEAIARMTDAELAPLALGADLLAEIDCARAYTSHGARKRQIQFLAKQLRHNEEAVLAIRALLDDERLRARRAAAGQHRIEAWRDRLVAEGDAALEELLAAHPCADPRNLRRLARQAHAETGSRKPPRAARELFRELRTLFDGKPTD